LVGPTVLWPDQASGCFGRCRGRPMARSASSGTRRRAKVRCAIYTRKSSEEGLQEEFNSLLAQHETCEAFINSQRHEGWVCLRAACDADQSSCCSRRAGLTRPSSAATRFPLRLAEREGVSPSYFTRLVRLSYLAPDITHAILDAAARSDSREAARALTSAARLARSADRARFCLSPIRTQNHRYR